MFLLFFIVILPCIVGTVSSSDVSLYYCAGAALYIKYKT